jgi:hypothetical protein
LFSPGYSWEIAELALNSNRHKKTLLFKDHQTTTTTVWRKKDQYFQYMDNNPIKIVFVGFFFIWQYMTVQS